MELGIRGKSALVTASSKGIGKAVAIALAAEGCKVAICARSKEDLIKVHDEIKSSFNTDVLWCVCDLNAAKDIDSTFNTVKKEFGRIDILVNNCGGPPSGKFRNLSEEHWRAGIEQTLMSVIRLCNRVVPDMMLAEWGRIINITSIAVKQPVDGLMLSNSIRSAVTGFAKTLSNELGKYNITVNNVAPGHTLTARLYDLAVQRSREENLSHEEVLADMARKVPVNRLAMPEEIASAVAFLSSHQAGYITGVTLLVDGGCNKALF